MSPEQQYFQNHADAILKAARGRLGPRDRHEEMTSRSIAALFGKAQYQAGMMKDVADFVIAEQKRGRRERPSHEFADFGEQLQAVARAAIDTLDWRLDYQQRAALGANEKTGDAGGYLVQTDFSEALLEATMYESEVASRCTEIPLSTGANSIVLPRVDETSRADGSRWGGAQSYWADEADSMTSSTSKFATSEMKLKKVFAVIHTTDELLADSRALGAWVSRVAPAELAFKLDTAVLTGNGTGQPLGIRNSPVLLTIAKEPGQAADSVLSENIGNMLSRLPAASVKRAAWFLSQSTMPQLASLTAGAGASPLLHWPTRTLAGIPFVPIEQASKLGDKGDIVLADMSRYLLATKGGVQFTPSIHVQFLTDQRAFRFILRVDGQPESAHPITPFNGGPAEAPFITLAERA